MKKIFLPLIAILFLFIVCSVSAAEEATSPESQPTPITKYEDIISNDGYSAGLQAGYGGKVWDGEEHHPLNTTLLLPNFTLPVSGVLMKDWITRGVLEYKCVVLLGVINSQHNRAMAGLFPLCFRYNLTGLKSRLVPYADVWLGMTYIDVPRQIQGTRYNFLASAGVGTQYFLDDHWALSAECRFMHLSNAGIKEPNEGQNYLFGLVGISRYFK